MLNKKTLICLISIGFVSACGETTSIQRSYTEARDECRDFSELKVSPAMRQQGGEAYKKQLLTGFGDCMQKGGWAVTRPSKDGEKKPDQFGQAPVPVQIQPLEAPPQAAENPDARRAAECSYARQAINHSSNARAIAKACDIECANQKRLAPDMPPPPACAP